jgi:hypothetical protein
MFAKDKSMIKRTSLIVMLLILLPLIAEAQEVGLMVALKGKVTILRDNKTTNAVLKDRIFLKDTIETKEESRAKMLFKDDSILTLAEKSRVNIEEYLSPEGRKKGKSIINLIDGKLRSLVGKNEFEVHTLTVVAAARGTYFFVWTEMEEGVPVSGVAVLEGSVYLSSINPAIAGVVTLEKGTMGKAFQNRAIGPAVPIPPSLMKELIESTDLQSTPELGRELIPEVNKPIIQPSLPSPIEREKQLPPTPPIENQIPSNTTPVHIRIPIPEGL